MITRLLVLILLSHEPLHGYGVTRALEEMRVDLWTDVKVGSVYHALQRMASEGLLSASPSTEGGRPSTIYAVNPAGEAELQRLLRKAASRPYVPFSPAFNAVVAAWPLLGTTDRSELLALLRARLGHAKRAWQQGAPHKGGGSGAPESVRASFDAGLAHLRVDEGLLDRLAEVSAPT